MFVHLPAGRPTCVACLVMGVAEPAPAAESRSGCVPASSNASIKTDWSVCVQRGMNWEADDDGCERSSKLSQVNPPRVDPGNERLGA